MINIGQIDTSGYRSGLHRSIKNWMQTTGLPIAADTVIEAIKNETAKGMRPDGLGTFLPYTSRYKKYKLLEVGNNSPVNLRLTGAMIGSIHYERISPNELYITVGDDELEKAIGVTKLRRFLAYSQLTKSNTLTIVEKSLIVFLSGRESIRSYT